MTTLQIFIISFLSVVGFMILCFMLRPAPKRTFYKQGEKLLVLAFLLCAQNFAFGQLFVSPRQVCQDGNDRLIETELRIILTGDSVILARTNERNSYPLRSVRRTRKGVVVKFGQRPVKNGQSNRLVLFLNKEQSAVLVLGEAHYFCWL